MLSYRHAFHAGNFADVLKHVVLTALLRYLTRKDSPLCYIDTHAGSGSYDLRSGYARKNSEFDDGIGRIWNVTDAPPPVSEYLELVRRFNKGGKLERYPGSPWIASELLRKHDRLVLCELHGSEYPDLEILFRRDRRVRCHAEDGYRFSTGLVPPAERRGLILMDPSYELKEEYDAVTATLGKLYRRFATGIYALWYPILDERRTMTFRRAFERIAIRDVLNIEMLVSHPQSLAGMYGCGMVLINPPWTLRHDMEHALPYLVQKLGREAGGEYRIEQWIEE